MVDVSSTLSLIEELYKGVTQPSGFKPFVRLLRQQLHAEYAGFATKAAVGQPTVMDVTDAATLADYVAYFHKVDPYCSPVASQLTLGQSCPTEAVLSRASLKRSEFFNDFMRRYRLGDGIVGVVDRSAAGTGILTILSGTGGSGYQPDEYTLVETLMPHIQRAVRLRAHCDALEWKVTRRDELLEKFSCPALVVETGGRILQANQLAAAMLAQRDGVLDDAKELAAWDPAQTRLLRKEIADAAMVVGSRYRVLRLARPSGATPMLALVSPLVAPRPSDHELALSRGHVLVLLRDPEVKVRVGPGVIARALDLTVAEARLVARLAAGSTVNEAAAKLKISHHTARNQLKSAMLKTCTRRQVELCQLVAMLQ